MSETTSCILSGSELLCTMTRDSWSHFFSAVFLSTPTVPFFLSRFFSSYLTYYLVSAHNSNSVRSQYHQQQSKATTYYYSLLLYRDIIMQDQPPNCSKESKSRSSSIPMTPSWFYAERTGNKNEEILKVSDLVLVGLRAKLSTYSSLRCPAIKPTCLLPLLWYTVSHIALQVHVLYCLDLD
jgi:hypothetical protein